jgi:hypothetical protein
VFLENFGPLISCVRSSWCFRSSPRGSKRGFRASSTSHLRPPIVRTTRILSGDIMDTVQQRGRSPSQGQRIHNHSHSPSPHAPLHHNVGLGFDSLQDPSSYAVTSAGLNSNQFLTTTQGQQFPQQATFVDPGSLQATQNISQHNTPQFGPQGSNNISPDPLDIANTNPDFNSFFQGNDLSQNQALPTYLGNTLDPQLLDSQPQQHQSVNPSDLMHQMATAQHNAPTPPHLLPTMNNHQSPSPHASPNINQGQFRSPGHSRHTSLDPSAAYGQPTNWEHMAQFQGRPRATSAHSDAYSDVASSVHNSPFLTQQDSFDNDQPSPLLHAQNDPQLFHDPVPGFDRFNLNNSNSHISASNSPHISPRLLPQNQHVLPQFQPDSFGLNQSMNPYAPQAMNGYPGHGPEPFPSLNQPVPEFGQADAMSPPEINIDFAPPSRQASFEPPKPEPQLDALSPPDRCKHIISFQRALLIVE